MEALAKSIRRAMDSDRPSSPGTLSVIPTARTIMACNLTCFRPKQSITEAINILLNHRFSGAPVVDDHGCLIGMLSEADCIRSLGTAGFHQHGDPGHALVGELMSQELTVVAPETDIYAIADRFLSDGLRRLPVIKNGHLVGQVSRRDVLRGMSRMA